MPSTPRWEAVILGCPEDRAYVERLSLALARAARVFHAGVVAPGEDRRRAMVTALTEALVIVVVGSRDSERDDLLTQDVQAAIARRRTQTLVAIVPVWRDDHVAAPWRQAIYGLAGTKAIDPADALAVDATASKIDGVLRGLRSAAQAQPRVAVVAVAAELGDVQHAVATRLQQPAPAPVVDELDAAAPDSLARAAAADYRLVLIGGRTGGTDTLTRLLDAGTDALRRAQLDLAAVVHSEVPALLALHARVPDTFQTVDQAASAAQERFARWLRAWAPPEGDPDGRHRALHPWELEYLVASLPGWRDGAGNLRAHIERRSIDRARLYVSLSAVATPWAHVDTDGKLVVTTPVDARARHPRHAPGEPGDAMEAGLTAGRERAELGAPQLEQLVSHPALPILTIEGEAGAGKTVLLQHVAAVLAARHLAEPAPATGLDLVALADSPLLRVPILVEASRLAERLDRGLPGELAPALAAVIRSAIGPAHASAVTDDAIDQGLRAGRYLVLIDSLDEVPDLARRRRVRDLVAALAARSASAPSSRVRVVLTTRPMAHTDLHVEGPGLAVARVAPVDRDQRTALADRWADAVGESTAYRAKLASALDELGDRHPRGEDERTVVENPQLLTCAFLVFDQQRLLPDSTASLYKRMVDILCDARPSKDLTAERKRQLLEAVGEALQRAGGTARSVESVADDLATMEPGRTRDDRIALIDRLAAETGLLRFDGSTGPDGRPIRIVRPWHRSFQEYLTACRLASAASLTDATDALLTSDGTRPPVALDPAWEGTLTFLVGVHANWQQDRALTYLTRLYERGRDATDPKVVGRLLGLAARGLAEYPDECPSQELRDTVRHELARRFAASGRDWPLRDRLLALDALGRLGDPRFEADRWVDVPGGTAIIGGDEKAYGARPRREVPVADFRMMWRPITVADYLPFVDDPAAARHLSATGVGTMLGFDAAHGYPGPGDWRRQLFHPSRPVVNVSWFEARAFCAWASAAWKLDVRLPAEIEWEHAARRPDGRFFPWGDTEPASDVDATEANHRMLGGHASPVGAFPRGDKDGLVDLAGNVWEWCIDVYDGEPVGDALGLTKRVVRGGSWFFDPWHLRCASRAWIYSLGKSWDLGFRVVCGGSRQP